MNNNSANTITNKLTKYFYNITYIFWIFYIGFILNNSYLLDNYNISMMCLLMVIICAFVEVMIIALLLIITFRDYRKQINRDRMVNND